MKRKPFRLALVQMRVEPGCPEVNLATAERLCQQAAHDGADVLLLPEALDCGWNHSSCRTFAGPIPDGPTYQRLARVAAAHQTYLCAGITERSGEDLFNSAVLISPDGELLLRHRKIHELELAHKIYELGDTLGVAKTAFGKFGVMICADAFAPGQVLSRSLGCMGAECILSPCSWAVPCNHDPVQEPYGQLWLDHYGPVARDFRIWIAGASNVGPIRGGEWDGRKCIGCSLVVGPDGKAALRGPYGEEAESILVCPIELEARSARGPYP